MYSYRTKRCIASLLLLVNLLIIASPMSVLAAWSEWEGFGTYEMKTISGYYKNGDESQKLIHMKGAQEGDKQEVVHWGNPDKCGVNTWSFDNQFRSDDWFQNNVIGPISNVTFRDFDNFVDKMSSSSGETQGANDGVGLSNLNQRMAVFTYIRLHPDLVHNLKSMSDVSNANLTSMFDSTLAQGHGNSYSNVIGKTGVVSNGNLANSNNGKLNEKASPYSLHYLGIMAIATMWSVKPNKETPVIAANDYCMYICLNEYMSYYNEWMVDIVKDTGWSANAEVKNTLTILKGFNDSFGDLIPCISMVWEHKNNDAKDGDNKVWSLKEMADEVDAGSPADSEVIVSADDSYKVNYDESTPIGDFYIQNSKTGILSYDRDKILGDIEVVRGLDETLKETKENEDKMDKTNLEDNYRDENILTKDDSKSLTEGVFGDSTGEFFNKVQETVTVEDLVTFDVDENGNSTSAGSVTIADKIITGMAYSATYIPMRTNLYSPDTIAQFDEKFRDEFFYKYGFHRKALYKDDNGAAAVAYYTAGGKFTGTKSICTLRDLIESGDNDVVLYVDDNFYNASKAIEWGNKKLDARLQNNTELCDALSKFAEMWRAADSPSVNTERLIDVMEALRSPYGLYLPISEAVKKDDDGNEYVDFTEYRERFSKKIKKVFDFDLERFNSYEEVEAFVANQSNANKVSNATELSDSILKTGDYNEYDNDVRRMLSTINDSGYLKLMEEQGNTFDSPDSLVLSSADIEDYMSMKTEYKEEHKDESGNLLYTNEYTAVDTYSEALPLAWVSCIYRNADLFSLAKTVEHNNPVFIASDDLCGITEANQWYRNSLLNYMLLKNLEENVQVDYNYVVDLDCPVYMDVFGNILTESGTVVIPAASNATLHLGSYKNYNISMGLYSVYGKAYSVPIDLPGAYSVVAPYFIADRNSNSYVINSIKLSVDGHSMRFDRINQYSEDVQKAVIQIYKNCIVEGNHTNLNWMAMVKISNEVMRGAPIEDIDKDEASLYSSVVRNKSATVAAVKLESLIESLKGKLKNTLMYIPDFTRVDGVEYYVAIAIKLIMVATSAVIIIFIYRDGVSGTLGLRTFFNALSSIALTMLCLTLVPAVFQLTYYGANKLLLHDEAMRILMVNTEKRMGGIEIGMTDAHDVQSDDDFSLQLDWIDVPWYEQLDDIMFQSSLDNLQKTKLKAYRESEAYNLTDVQIYNDGVYISTDELFDSVSIDYTFNETTSGNKGLYLRGNNSQQSAGFYSPYYAFLRILVANINEYNTFRSTGSTSNNPEENNMYTTKYLSNNEIKTVGLCYNYFTSPEFMGVDVDKDEENKVVDNADFDIMRLYQIYGLTNAVDENSPIMEFISKKEYLTSGEALLFNDTHREQFRSSLWYNNRFVFDEWFYSANSKKLQKKLNKRSLRNLERSINEFDKRIEAMDSYARDFIANNRDMLTKVTDETFIKVMALHMAIKYNQLFGVNSANSLEIYNLDSNDLLRLCIVRSNEAAAACPMSYSRYVYNFGGESSVYAAAVLTMIMWLGSFIKPMCTIIVFISVFVSIWVFRVVLRRPSANLMGYLTTVLLLCGTNVFHSLLLKISINLPNMGLSPLGCLMFLIFGQVCYLLILSYVTGVSLKDWSNLGMNEYSKEAKLLKSKFKKEDTSAMLSGDVKHHDDNWEYYNDLVSQHRQRNTR